MSVPAVRDLDPLMRRRNRITLVILVIVMLTAAVSGVLYLRHFGFPPLHSESRYH